MPSKKPEELLPGFEVYAKLKPIVPFWQWFVAALVLGVLSLRYAVFGGSPTDLLGVLVFVLIFVVAAFVFALIVRRRSLTVGIKREGDRLLMVGQTVSENLTNRSKVEFMTPTSVYIERSGTRMQLRKMVLLFESPEDAQKLVDWLHEKIGSPKSASEMIPNYAGDIWALVYAGEYAKRSKIIFERNILFVVDPGNNIFDVHPKTVDRKDQNTIVAKTGFWHQGNIVMKFDSTSDTDKVEQELRRQSEQKNMKG